MTSASAGYAPAATTLAQMRRPIIEPSPQLQLSTIIPTSKSSCCRLPGASTASNASADLPPHFPRHSIPHSGLAATSPPYLPRVRSLAAFGRRPPVDVAQLSMAGIRNPAQNPSATVLPQRLLSPVADMPRCTPWAAMGQSTKSLRDSGVHGWPRSINQVRDRR